MIRKLLHFLTSRLVVTALLIAAQAVLLFMIILKMSNYFILFLCLLHPAQSVFARLSRQ